MHDERQADEARQLDLRAEGATLRVPRREVAVEVEAALADGDDAWTRGERLELGQKRIIEQVRLVALAIYPVIPGTAEEILRRLGQAHTDADLLLENAIWTALTPAAVVVGAPLFPRIEAGS